MASQPRKGGAGLAEAERNDVEAKAGDSVGWCHKPAPSPDVPVDDRIVTAKWFPPLTIRGAHVEIAPHRSRPLAVNPRTSLFDVRVGSFRWRRFLSFVLLGTRSLFSVVASRPRQGRIHEATCLACTSRDRCL